MQEIIYILGGGGELGGTRAPLITPSWVRRARPLHRHAGACRPGAPGEGAGALVQRPGALQGCCCAQDVHKRGGAAPGGRRGNHVQGDRARAAAPHCTLGRCRDPRCRAAPLARRQRTAGGRGKKWAQAGHAGRRGKKPRLRATLAPGPSVCTKGTLAAWHAHGQAWTCSHSRTQARSRQEDTCPRGTPHTRLSGLRRLRAPPPRGWRVGGCAPLRSRRSWPQTHSKLHCRPGR